MTTKRGTLTLLLASLPFWAIGCGVVEQGRSPSVVRITELTASGGSGTVEFGGTLHSDVVTKSSIFNDIGFVKMRLDLKDPGAPGITNAPSALNTVTFTHYRAVYRRTDGRNVEGVDVPYAFDSGLTFTVPATGEVSAQFDIVRASAKKEAPLLALAINGDLINTITDVTFYGKDQANNNVTVTGSIGITFANFADPE